MLYIIDIILDKEILGLGVNIWGIYRFPYLCFKNGGGKCLCCLSLTVPSLPPPSTWNYTNIEAASHPGDPRL